MNNKNKKAAAQNAAAPKSTKKASGYATQAAEMMDKLGIDTIFCNDAGEFFTQQNLAMLSVKQDAKRIATYTKTGIPAVADASGVDGEGGEGESGEGGEGSGEQE